MSPSKDSFKSQCLAPVNVTLLGKGVLLMSSSKEQVILYQGGPVI